jgi:ABC-type multidrug transport system ATPase subunit
MPKTSVVPSTTGTGGPAVGAPTAKAPAPSPVASPAISVRDVRYAYGAHEAVKGISFDVAPGEVLGFLGPNGAGKSTTIKMITGQLEPRSGSVHVLGMDVRRERDAVQARIGVCFEEKNLYLAMSGVENLRFFASLFGIGNLDAMALLERVGLSDRGRDRVAGYSKGMRQRLMMARALVNDPAVLVLDEPTDGLDPVSSQTIRGLIRDQAARGTAVLLTTHDMWEADELSHRVAFINDGRIYADGPPETLKLSHGRRTVKVRVREDGAVREHVIPLGDTDHAAQLARAVEGRDLLTIHTEEATLEAVFIQMTGRALA